MGVKRRVSRRSEIFITVVAILVLVGSIGLGVGLGTYKYLNPDTRALTEEETMIEAEEVEIEPEIVAVDFQTVIDEWAKNLRGNKSVYIFDLNLDEEVGAYNAKEDYDTASLYKLFVVYEGHKRVASGEWNGETKTGSTGYTINKCLDLAIRESNSDCAEVLWGMLGRNNLNAIIENEWGIVNSNISKLYSNAIDIFKMMKRFYEHPDFDDSELLARMWDSFLNQPKTEYDWRQGLPSGFTQANVYNKVGWDYNPDKKYWNLYHDAAIVEFPLEDGSTRNFVVVVMSSRVDFKNIRKLGTMLEDEFYKQAEI